MDNIMKGLQVGMQDDIEELKNKVRELEEKLKNADDDNYQMRSELAALASGDENELNKIILGLRNELDKVKMSKDAENKALKDAFSEKEDELKALKNMLNQQNKEQMPSPESPQDYSTFDIDRLKDMLDEKDTLIKLLRDQLENEKNQNNALKEDLNLVAESDDSALKEKILALSAELENLKSKPSADAIQPEEAKPETLMATSESVGDKIRDLENLLKSEKELTDRLKKEIADEKDKYDKLASADDNELKRMLADAEKNIEELNKEKENNEKIIKSLELENKRPPSSLESKQADKQMPDDYEQLKKENIELKDEIYTLKNKLNKLQEGEIPTNTDDLMKENEDLKNENKALKNEIEILKGAKKDQDSTAKRIPDTSGSMKEPSDVEKNALLKENNELKNDIEMLRKQLGSPSQTEPSQTDEEIKRKLNQLENENEQLKTILKDEKDKCNETIANKDKNIKELQDKLNQLQKENVLPQVEKQSEQQQVDPGSTKIEDLKKKINELESQNNALKKDKDNCNENIKGLNDNINKLQEEKNNLETVVNKLKDSPQNVSSSPSKADMSSNQELQQCIQDKQKLEKELDKLKQTLAKNQAQEEQTKVPVTKSQEEKDNELLKDNDISLLKNENTKLNDTNEKLKQDLEKLKQELEELKKKDQGPVLETLMEKDTKIPDDISKKLQEENSKLKSKVKELEDKILRMQPSYPEEQAKYSKEKGITDASDLSDPQSLIEIKNENSKLLKDNEDLRNEISSLKKKLNEAQEKISGLENENEKYLNLLNNADKSGGIYDNSLLDICKNNLEKQIKENSNLKERIAALEKDLKQTKIPDLTTDDGGRLEQDKPRAQEEKSDKPILTKKEILKEQPSTPKKTLEKSDASAAPKSEADGKVKASDIKSEIPFKEQVLKKANIDKSEKPLAIKTGTPKEELSTDERVKTPEKGTPKTQPTKSKDGIDKKTAEQPGMKKEVESVKTPEKDTPKDQPAKSKDVVDKKKDPLMKKEVESVKTPEKVVPKDQTTKAKDLIDKKKEQSSIKKELDGVKPKDQPAKAKDVIDKTREKEESSQKPDSAALSTEQKPAFKEKVRDKKETKPDIEKSTQKVKTKALENEFATDKDGKGKKTPEKLAPKDDKTLPAKDIAKPKDTKKKSREEVETDRKYVDGDETKAIPDFEIQTRRLGGPRFPKKDTSPKYETKSGLDEDKEIPEASGKYFKERKKPDMDLMQKGQVDVRMLSDEKAKDEPQIKEKAKSRLARGVGEALDLTTGKEKAQKRKREIIGEKREQDYDVEGKEKPKYKSLTIEMKDKIDKEAGMVKDSSKTYEPDLLEAEKPIDHQAYGDKKLHNELNELRQKLSDAEKLIKHLKNENVTLKTKIENLKQVKTQEKIDKYEEYDKFLDEDAKKLNRILRKAINHGLKTLYLDELEYVHDSLNNTMADRLNRPQTPGTKSPEELERLIYSMEQKMASMMGYLNNYRELSSEHSKKNLQYSQKVQQLNTVLGMQKMDIETLVIQNRHLRDLLDNEKERVRNLEEMLRSVLDNCKCTRKGVLNQYFPGLKRQ